MQHVWVANAARQCFSCCCCTDGYDDKRLNVIDVQIDWMGEEKDWLIHRAFIYTIAWLEAYNWIVIACTLNKHNLFKMITIISFILFFISKKDYVWVFTGKWRNHVQCDAGKSASTIYTQTTTGLVSLYKHNSNILQHNETMAREWNALWVVHGTVLTHSHMNVSMHPHSSYIIP